MVKKYDLIDLYDGKHNAKSVVEEDSIEKLCNIVAAGIEKRKHTPFYFHTIGSPTIHDRIGKIIYGRMIAFSERKFDDFLKCLYKNNQNLWIAPLVDIYKYQTEYESSALNTVENSKSVIKSILSVKTDNELYDQNLTLIVPGRTGATPVVKQNSVAVSEYRKNGDERLFNVKPINSTIEIYYIN